MGMKIFFTVFISVFIAELGDKTQLATILFASDKQVNKLTVFSAAALALVASTAIGVLAGATVSGWFPERNIKIAAGMLFVAIGVWTIYKAF